MMVKLRKKVAPWWESLILLLVTSLGEVSCIVHRQWLHHATNSPRLQLQDRALRDLPCKRVRCDEIWQFCYAKEKNVRLAFSNSSHFAFFA